VRTLITTLCLLLCLAGILTFAWNQVNPHDVATALARGQYDAAARRLESRLAENGVAGQSLLAITLGNLYYVGLGVAQDYKRSGELYSEAAFSGQIAAQVNMGHLYANGLGVTEDGKLAYAWFNLARSNGSKIAQQYMSSLLADHKVSGQHVQKIRRDYATLQNFPRLH